MIWRWGLATITVAPPGDREMLTADKIHCISGALNVGQSFNAIRHHPHPAIPPLTLPLLRDTRFNCNRLTSAVVSLHRRKKDDSGK